MAAAFSEAGDALGAAVDAQRSLLLERWPTAAPVRVRMGLHTGVAIERGGDFFGPTVIRAARLMSLVAGGRIVCSSATGDALPAAVPDVELLAVGTVHLKGLSAPEVALAVRAPGLSEAGRPVDGARPGWRRPGVTSSLIARDDVVADVAGRVVPAALVTLVGAGGVGKTRLALAVADRVAPAYAEQVAWLDLTTLDDPSAIVYELAALLGVRAPRGEDLTDKVATAIGDRELVVVLDGCEHVRASVRLLAQVLLERCPGLALLATSRELLGLPPEQVVSVGPLESSSVESAAVELLIQRVGSQRVELDDAELATLYEIAKLLDGVPLALELVAARCRRLGIIEVGRRLPGRLGELSDPGRAARHQTLDGTIDWSYAMLRPTEQALLRTLAVFSGTFDLQGAEAVAAQLSLDVATTLTSLLDKSLIEREGRRFRLLEMTRDFASRRRAEADERDATAAHTRYVRSHVVEIRKGLHGRKEARWVEELDAVWPDVRTTVRRALDDDDAEAAIELVSHLAFEAFWRRPEAFTWIEEAVARWGDRPGPNRHELLGAAGIAAWTQADVEAGVRLGTAALAAAPEPGTALDCLPEGAAIGAFLFSGRFEDGMAVARRALTQLDLGVDGWNRAVMHANLANALGISGAHTPELDHEVDTSIGLAFATGNPTAIAYAYLVHALATSTTDPVSCRIALEHARAYASEVDNHWVLTTAATTIAMRPVDAPDEAAVTQALDAAADLRRTGWTAHAWCAMWGVIAGLSALNRAEVAALVLGACEASGVARLAYQPVPSELEDVASPTAPFRRLGRHMSFDDLLTFASGQRRPPLLPPDPSRTGREA